MKKIRWMLPVGVLLMFCATVRGQIITTIAGQGGSCGGAIDGIPPTAGQLNHPTDIAIDTAGNIYITDRLNAKVRKITATTGLMTTFAGTGFAGYSGNGGPATAAQLQSPYGIAVDASGNVYFTDGGNCVRKVSTSGIITTVAGTPGILGFNGDNIPATAAQFNGAGTIMLDAAGNMYVADSYNHRVRKIGTSGIIVTIAGTGTKGVTGDGGPATAANIGEPNGLAMDAAGNLYIGDQDSANCVRKINAAGVITTFAGTPLSPGDAGDNGQATAARIGKPIGVATDIAGNVYITDVISDKIRKVTPAGIITTYAGAGHGFSGDNGPAINALMSGPLGIKTDVAGNVLLTEYTNCCVRRISSILAIDDLASTGDIKVYPNPCRSLINVEINGISWEDAHIVITNILGEKVKEITGNANRSLQVPLNEPAGIYMLSVVTRNGMATRKIVVE